MATVAEQCKQTLEAHYGDRLAGLVLFGSAARGADDRESDLDLLVLLSRPLDYFEELRTIADVLYPVQLESDRLISAKPASEDAFERGEVQLYRNAKREGVRLRLLAGNGRSRRIWSELSPRRARPGCCLQLAMRTEAASRAYYAAFYGATAALLREGFDFGKHSGVIAAVHRRFVKPGRLDKQFGRDLNWLFELRSVGDYGETQHVPHEEAGKAIETAERFLKAIGNLPDAENG